ncbi:DUF3971 domain-containing protein [Rhodosalinus sp. K401]|uniref:YhdP family protein n=1 Tax=Rhodosalinus sp. K401 TaxID=3239195 RepID=UPI003524A8F2
MSGPGTDGRAGVPSAGRRRAGLWGLVALALALAGLAAAALSLGGRGVAAPDWLVTRVEARLQALAPGLDVEFGALTLRLGPEGQPVLGLRRVSLADASGTEAATISELDATLALRPILSGRLEPSALRVAGAILTVRRDRSGRLDLAIGTPRAAGTRELRDLVARIDEVALRPQFARLGSVEARAVTLRYEDARAGRAWTADGGRLRIERQEGALRLSGDFALLSGHDRAARIALNAESPIGARDIAFGVTFDGMSATDIATQSPALAWLEVLRAPISGALRGAVDGHGALGPLHATLQISEGVLQPSPGTQPVPFRSARSYFTYDPRAATITFDEIRVDSAWISARAEGRALLKGLETGWPTELVAQIRVADMSAAAADLYDGLVTVERASADVKIRLDPFEVTLGQMVLDDPDLPLRLSGRASAHPEGWRVALDASAEMVSPEQVVAWWPPGQNPNTRRWVARNVLGGRLVRPAAALRIAPGASPRVHVTAGLDGARVRVLRGLPPVENGRGHLTLAGDRLAIAVEDGRVATAGGGRVDLAGSTFVIPDLRKRPARAEIGLEARAPIPDALWLLDQAPFRFLEKAGRGTDLAKGRVRLEGRVTLPMRPDIPRDAIDFAFAGQLLGVESTSVVPGRQLEAPALDLVVDREALVISGAGRIDGVPFDAEWRAPLGEGGPGQGSRLSGEVELGRRFAEVFAPGLPPDGVSGAARAALDVVLPPGGPPSFTLRSDLRGLGATLPAIGWTKGPDARGRLEVAGVLGAQGRAPRIDRLRLELPGLDAAGRIDLRDGGGLAQAVFERVRVGAWLDTQVTLTGRGPGMPPEVALNGGRLDMAAMPELGAAGAGGAAGGLIVAALDRVALTDRIVLEGFRGRFSTGEGIAGAFTADVGGQAPIRGELIPRAGGRPALRLASEDAGGVFRAAGLLRQASGGAMTLALEPGPQPGSQDGFLSITDVRLRDAPVMAELLNALSIVGLLEQMGGQGIYFSDVEARFRLTPDRVIVSRASAVGPSMGVSLDGYYGRASRQLDMQGVLSPVYLVNVVGAPLTRRGEGLIGFNFQITGDARAPRVAVNPLSALTPGMFREIFRRPPPQLSQ